MNNWGTAMVASKRIPNSIKNVYSQTYKLQPNLYPTGAVAEGPGDYSTHLEVEKWFEEKPQDAHFEQFNTSEVVFYDNSTNFQTMETTIGGLGDAILFYTLVTTLGTE